MIIKESVRSLSEYTVPQESPVKLNQNESPFDLPGKLKEEILVGLANHAWNRYPPGDVTFLRQKIADYTGISHEGILLGCGSNELIQTLIQATCDTGDRIAVVTPGFSVYSRVASVLNVTVNEIPLKQDFSFDVKRIAEEASEDRLVFLASPNNPTGIALSRDEVEFLAENLKGLLVVDEAYFEFSRETAQTLLSRFERLLILRTFSKAWGLAGLRLGYLLGKPAIVHELGKAKLPFSIGIFPLIAGQILLRDPQLVRNIANTVISERERVFKALSTMPGIDPIPSRANFLLFRTLRLSGKELFDRFRVHGILLRHFESPELSDFLRVTLGKPHENEAFLIALKSILGGKLE